MTKGSKGSGQSASNTVGMAGYAYVVPVETSVSSTVAKGSGGGVGSYEMKSQVSYGDKQSGSYGRVTATEKASGGDFEWKNGTSGTRSEYKQSSSVRVGDKSGYTEVYSEQRVREVSYNRNNEAKSNSNSEGSYMKSEYPGKDYIIYDNGRGRRGYGGYY